MCQYANMPIGCAMMPHGNWHIGKLTHYPFAKLVSFFGIFIHSFRFITYSTGNYSE